MAKFNSNLTTWCLPLIEDKKAVKEIYLSCRWSETRRRLQILKLIFPNNMAI